MDVKLKLRTKVDYSGRLILDSDPNPDPETQDPDPEAALRTPATKKPLL